MANHTHKIRRDRIHEKLAHATALGERKIPPAMTLPVALIKSALRDMAEAIDDARLMIRDQHTEGDRDKESGKLTKPAVVYATKDDDGVTPVFKMDDKGNPTTERLVAQGKIQLINSVEYNRELRAFDRDFCEVVAPHVSWPQLEGKVATIEANIVEGLMEFFDDLPGSDKATPAAGKKPAARSGAKGAPTEPAAT